MKVIPTLRIKYMKELSILKETGFAIQVCTNLKTKGAIERATNRVSTCGTELGWRLDEKVSRRLKQSMVPCAEKTDYNHWILYA